jgi:hypothetical protein
MSRHMFRITLTNGCTRCLIAGIDPDDVTRIRLAEMLCDDLRRRHRWPHTAHAIADIIYHGLLRKAVSHCELSGPPKRACLDKTSGAWSYPESGGSSP